MLTTYQSLIHLIGFHKSFNVLFKDTFLCSPVFCFWGFLQFNNKDLQQKPWTPVLKHLPSHLDYYQFQTLQYRSDFTSESTRKKIASVLQILA